MSIKESKSETKDPICGMTVDRATVIHAERDGKRYFFCAYHCRDSGLDFDWKTNDEEDYEGVLKKAAQLVQ